MSQDRDRCSLLVDELSLTLLKCWSRRNLIAHARLHAKQGDDPMIVVDDKVILGPAAADWREPEAHKVSRDDGLRRGSQRLSKCSQWRRREVSRIEGRIERTTLVGAELAVFSGCR